MASSLNVATTAFLNFSDLLASSPGETFRRILSSLVISRRQIPRVDAMDSVWSDSFWMMSLEMLMSCSTSASALRIFSGASLIF